MILHGTWKEALWSMDTQDYQSMNDVAEESYNTKAQDIGLVHPTNGAGLLVRENQKIEAYSNFGLGFRLDPDTQSFSVFAPNIKFFTNEFKVYDYEEEKSYFQDEYQDIMDMLGEKGDVNVL